MRLYRRLDQELETEIDCAEQKSPTAAEQPAVSQVRIERAATAGLSQNRIAIARARKYVLQLTYIQYSITPTTAMPVL